MPNPRITKILNIHKAGFCDLKVFYHGTDIEGKKSLIESQTFNRSLLQSRDHGFFGKGFYVADSPQQAKHYGKYIVKVILKPGSKVLCALEPGKYSGIIPTEIPSFHEDFKNYYLSVISQRKGLGYAAEYINTYLTPGEPDFDRLTWYKFVTSWCEKTGYADAVNWLSETIILKPEAIMEIL